jgi:hypothetical protein
MTTHSSHGSRPDGHPRTVPWATARQPLPYPSAAASDRRPPRRSGLPGRVRLPPKHHPAQSAADAPPPTCTRPAQRCPHPCSSGRRPSHRGRAGPPGTRLDPVVTAARRPEVSPIATARRTRDETAATGRTDRHQPAGHRTGWTPAGRTAASGQGSQMTGHWTGWTPDGWTPGPRTAGRLGWTPKSGHRLAMDSRQHRGITTAATRTLPLGCCLEAPPGRRRVG